jgi:hypothetical protein
MYEPVCMLMLLQQQLHACVRAHGAARLPA